MSEFDQYAQRYNEIHNSNLSIIGEDSSFFDEHKVLELKRLLDSKGLEGRPLRILDYGCGIGKTRPYMQRHLPQVDYLGVDMSEQSIAVARSQDRNSIAAPFQAFDGKRIPAADGTIDVVFVACVLHHVPPAEREGVYREWRRVLKPGGFVFVFEHNPYNPVTRHIVNTCEFDRDAVLLQRRELQSGLQQVGFKTMSSCYVLFLPKNLRRWFGGIEQRLTWLPLGGQYWVAAWT